MKKLKKIDPTRPITLSPTVSNDFFNLIYIKITRIHIGKFYICLRCLIQIIYQYYYMRVELKVVACTRVRNGLIYEYSFNFLVRNHV